MQNLITIARQYGSGGRQIGQLLAEKLQVPFYDKQLVAMAAKKSGVSEAFFQSADEKHASSILYSLVMGNYCFGMPRTATNLPLNDQLFLLQEQIIKEAAEKGPCVIVGRCANYILRDRPHIFRVFLYADRKFRVQHAVSDYGIDPKKAEEIVTKTDKQRASYCSFYTSQHWNDPECYDLCLNTGNISFEGAVQLIIEASSMKTN
ncbi:MAG: cytidylate kinase-like family protein [Oscillospiraceae bacterium]|jgi:cytidylate kinase|nr:cytidylate kinase-like family protein [Oscillospiraceae bacterium]MDD3260757.1 cytidylate kinase-like family protein [Oscillospiraceae bacterium]